MRVFIAALAAIATTSILSAAQTPAPQIPKIADVTVTGCLIQGSAPEIYILDNARMNPKDANEAAKKYLLISAVEDMPLKDLVNHEVSAVGSVQLRTDVTPQPPPTEKDLPTFTARSLSTLADRCTSFAGR